MAGYQVDDLARNERALAGVESQVGGIVEQAFPAGGAILIHPQLARTYVINAASGTMLVFIPDVSLWPWRRGKYFSVINSGAVPLAIADQFNGAVALLSPGQACGLYLIFKPETDENGPINPNSPIWLADIGPSGPVNSL